jgi:hypothetical protein
MIRLREKGYSLREQGKQTNRLQCIEFPTGSECGLAKIEEIPCLPKTKNPATCSDGEVFQSHRAVWMPPQGVALN